MRGKSFVAIYTGAPLLDQLNDDLREAEMYREAPRLAVPEDQVRAIRGETWRDCGISYELVDDRESQTAASVDANPIPHILGSFKLKSGELAHFALLDPSGNLQIPRK